jgi:DNA invertase Pin-like site-specific DNA recombinase
MFAEMERTFINERTTAGKMTAKAKGIKLGRKGKSKGLVDQAIDLWLSGQYTIKEIEERTTVRKSTLYREIHKRGLTNRSREWLCKPWPLIGSMRPQRVAFFLYSGWNSC